MTPTIERINECFALDANALSEEMLRFLHQPMAFEHRSVRRTEQDFLADTQHALIVGAPGSGKSSFLRWVEMEMRELASESDAKRGGFPEPNPPRFASGSAASAAEDGAFSTEQFRDRLIADLREEQQQAQARVAAAREQGGTPDSVDRDVAGWLAQGLCDLFADPITGQQFLIEGQGIVAVMAEQVSSGAIDARFSESDLLRSDNLRFTEASRPAQMMVTKLTLSSTNQFRVAAANLMNRIIQRIPPPCPPPEAGGGNPTLPPLRGKGRVGGRSPVVFTEDIDRLRELVQQPGIRVIGTSAEEIATDPPIHVWRIVDPSPQEAIELAGAYLAACREPLPAWMAEIAGHCASHNGRVLYPFREGELLALLFRDGETTISRRIVLERIRERLLEEASANREREDVRTFLTALDAGGASLNLLTNVVLQWLRENGQFDVLRVVRHDSGPK